jgi:hypothetical protein
MQANNKSYAELGMTTYSLNSNKSSNSSTKHIVQPIHVRGNNYNNVPYDYNNLEQSYDNNHENITETPRCSKEKFTIIAKVLRKNNKSATCKDFAKFYYNHHKMINATPLKHFKNNLITYFDTPNLTNSKFNILIGKKPSTIPHKHPSPSLENGLYIKYRNNRLQPIRSSKVTLGQSISNIKSIIFVNLSKSLNLVKHYFNQNLPNINQIRAILNTIPLWIHPQSILSNTHIVTQEYRRVLNLLVSKYQATKQQITNLHKNIVKPVKITSKPDINKQHQSSVHTTLTVDTNNLIEQIEKQCRIWNIYEIGFKLPAIPHELLFHIIKQHCSNPKVSNQQDINKANKMNSAIRYHNIKQHKSEPLLPVPSPKYEVHVGEKWPRFCACRIDTTNIRVLNTQAFDAQDTFTTNDQSNKRFLNYPELTTLRSIEQPRAIDNKYTFFINGSKSIPTPPSLSSTTNRTQVKPITFISSSTSSVYDNTKLSQSLSPSHPAPSTSSSVPKFIPKPISTISAPSTSTLREIKFEQQPQSKTTLQSIADYLFSSSRNKSKPQSSSDYFSSKGSNIDPSQELD